MEKYSFFNSVEGDRTYQASDFADYFKRFLTSGVFPKPSTSLQVLSNDSYTISLQPGYAMLEGYMYYNTDVKNIVLDAADGVLNRIDYVMVQLDLANRKIETIVKKGTPATSPVPPSIIRSESIFELVLAQIYIPKSAASISQMNITDVRMNSEICGWVNSTIQADTSAIFDQYESWFNTRTAEYEQSWDEWFQEADSWLQSVKDQIANDDHTVMNERLDNLELNEMDIYQRFEGVYQDISDVNEKVTTLENQRILEIVELKADQSVPSNNYSNINWGTGQIQAPNFNEATQEWVAPKTGRYKITANVNFRGMTRDYNAYTRFVLNGAGQVNMYKSTTSNGDDVHNHIVVLDLIAGDRINFGIMTYGTTGRIEGLRTHLIIEN